MTSKAMFRASVGASVMVALATSAACSNSGSGPAVRADITARMQTTSDVISACYAEALTRNRKLAGMIMLSITAAPDSGAFTNVTTVRDEVGDTTLRQCVIAEVSKLKLSQPQKTNVDIRYPLTFAPVE